MYYTKQGFPETLTIETTTLCNSHCTICPYGKITRAAKMSMENFRSLVDECARHPVKHIALSLYGEPLMDTFIVRRVRYIRKVLPNCEICIFTNGSLMTKDTGEELLDAGLSHIIFSVDGLTANTYNKVRPLDFDLVVANIHTFLEMNDQKGHPCKTRVHMTATKETIAEAGRFVEHWNTVQGVDIASWLPCDGRGGTDREKAVQPEIFDGPCWAPFGCTTILTNGNAVVCCQDYGGAYPMGNVFAEGIEAVWNGVQIDKVRELHNSTRKRELPLCTHCHTRY